MIFRTHRKKHKFTILDTTALNDERLSLKAKGLICYLLAKPDNWKPRVKEIEKNNKDGESSIRTAIKELTTFGYCKLEKIRDEKGVIKEQVYNIFEEPQDTKQLNVNPFSDNINMDKHKTGKDLEGKTNKQLNVNTFSDFPHVDYPNVENRHINNTYSNKINANKIEYNIEREGKQNFQNQTTPTPTNSNSFQEEEKLGKTSSEIPTSPLGNEGLQRKKVAIKKESLSSRRELDLPRLFTFDLNTFSGFLSDLKEKVGISPEDIYKSHYHNKIKLHATSKSLQKTIPEWKAYIKKWIFEDKENGKLKLAPIQADNKPKPSPLGNEGLVQQKINRQAKLMDITYSPENAESIKEEFRILWKDATAVQQTDIKYIIDNLKIKEVEKLKTVS